jgi:hypothetical protein
MKVMKNPLSLGDEFNALQHRLDIARNSFLARIVDLATGP